MKYFYLILIILAAFSSLYFIRESVLKKRELKRISVEDSINAVQKARADSIYFAILLEAEADKTNNLIIINKNKFTLEIWRGFVKLREFTVALGKNPNDKTRVGDNATPVGDFMIEKIEDSSDWTHDFNDGKGEIEGAYGPYFLRLKTGKEETVSGMAWTGIGIHGTHDNSSIGTNASEGCVRMKNEELVDMMKFVEVGTGVKIEE
ncbi:MAG: L,D-transpeptidase [bacterium]|nr:L,D-transpeptidase [bacterium]